MSYSAKTKRDRQTDGQTDRQTDGGRCNISRPGPSAPREITNSIQNKYILSISNACKINTYSHQTWIEYDFDFIECFTTTFLRAHSWLNWVDEDDDEDEVGLKEKPEDTRYIKKITSK